MAVDQGCCPVPVVHTQTHNHLRVANSVAVPTSERVTDVVTSYSAEGHRAKQEGAFLGAGGAGAECQDHCLARDKCSDAECGLGEREEQGYHEHCGTELIGKRGQDFCHLVDARARRRGVAPGFSQRTTLTFVSAGGTFIGSTVTT